MKSSFSLVPNVVSGMILAMLVGAALASLTVWLFRHRRATSRLVDLVSFSLAGVGLIASLFAVSSYEKRLDQAERLVELGRTAITAAERIYLIVKEQCTSSSGAASTDLKTIECGRIREYTESLFNLDFARGALLPPPPSILSLKSTEVSKASSEIYDIVFNYNLSARNLLFEEQRRVANVADELTIIIYAAYTISFAFGIGWVRRVSIGVQLGPQIGI